VRKGRGGGGRGREMMMIMQGHLCGGETNVLRVCGCSCFFLSSFRSPFVALFFLLAFIVDLN
jgi:hypothetical protein